MIVATVLIGSTNCINFAHCIKNLDILDIFVISLLHYEAVIV